MNNGKIRVWRGSEKLIEGENIFVIIDEDASKEFIQQTLQFDRETSYISQIIEKENSRTCNRLHKTYNQLQLK